MIGSKNWGGLLRHLTTRRAIDRFRQKRSTQEIRTDLPGRVSEQPETIVIE